MSNRDNSNSRDNNLRFNNQNNNLRRKFSGSKDNLRFSSQDNNLRRKFGSRKDRSKDLRFSNHNTLSLKGNQKEGRKKNRIESKMTKGSLYDQKKVTR